MAKVSKQTENETLPATPVEPAVVSCRKSVKSADAGFVDNMRARFGDFIATPMDEHKQCLKYTVKKVVNMAKFGGDKKPEMKEAESPVPLKTSSAK